MIFFREREELIRINKSSEIHGFHVKVKAVFANQVDADSGMTVNLKDVDDWMKRVAKKLPVFKSTREILSFYFRELAKLSSKLVRVELSRDHSHFEFDGEKMTYVYDVPTWFQEDKTLMQRRVKIFSAKALSKKWRTALSNHKWSDPSVMAKKLKKKVKSISQIEVQNKEWNAWVGF